MVVAEGTELAIDVTELVIFVISFGDTFVVVINVLFSYVVISDVTDEVNILLLTDSIVLIVIF
jgi:hypothetical protein